MTGTAAAGRRGIDQVLAEARAGCGGWIRTRPRRKSGPARCSSTSGRSRSGPPRGRCPAPCGWSRNVLEWRFDPASASRLPQARGYDIRVIVMCSEGYTSSLAAASLQDLGLASATDLAGGFRAWAAAGLPVTGKIT